MATFHYKRMISDFFDRLPYEAFATTDMIVAYIVEMTEEPEDKVRKTVNVNLSRLEQENVLSRISRGLYCKRIKTAFGDYAPSKDIIYARKLINDGGEVIGYETGLSFMNHIGLISQVPRKSTISSNNYALSIPKDIGIEVHKPRTQINSDNYRYLQLLDAIDRLENAPVDVDEPGKIIRENAVHAGLEPDQLILYARYYYPVKTLKATIDIILGGMNY